MAHTYTLNLLHVVFSTKNRAPMIRDLDRLLTNLRGIARNKNINVLAAGGTNNHVHLLLRIPPVRPVSESMRDLKANSSRYMNEVAGGGFAWQDGYAAISVSPSQVPAVRSYIEDQERHTRNEPSSGRLPRCSTNRASPTNANFWPDIAADAAPALCPRPTRR